jgi:hypothetical protein
MTDVSLAPAGGIEPVPVPVVRSLDEAIAQIDALDGSLVTIGRLQLNSGDGWPSGGGSALLEASGGLHAVMLEISAGTGFEDASAPAGYFEATGVLLEDAVDALPIDPDAATAVRHRLRLRSPRDIRPVRDAIREGRPPREEIGFDLGQNGPNPFNPVTTIAFSIHREAPVKLDIFSLDGRRVKSLVDGVTGAGTHEVLWDGTDDAGRPLGSGLYFYSLESGGKRVTRKMIMSK